MNSVETKPSAEAGHWGKDIRSDLHVAFEASDGGGIEISLESRVAPYYGQAILDQARAVLAALGVEHARVAIHDEGALPFTIGARIEAAARRAGAGAGKHWLPEQHPLPPSSPKERLRRSRLYLPGSEPKYFINSALHVPDAVILDLTMPGRSGLEVLEEARRLRPKTPVLVLTAYPEAQFAVRSFKLGASGYLTKQSVSDELVTAIQRILAGGKYVTASLAERLAVSLGGTDDQAPHEALSNRELQVLRLIAVGKSIKETAAELALSEKTVATYRTRISEKAGLKTNVEIARYALKHGLVE